MKNVIRKASLSALLACAFIGTAAQAGGEVLVINETDQAITPYFRYNCFGFTPAPSTVTPDGWVNFGGIGARSRFGWTFSDPFLTRPDCSKPKLEFTYTAAGAAPPPKKPDIAAKMKFDPLVNFHLQAGEKLKAINLRDHDDDDDD